MASNEKLIKIYFIVLYDICRQIFTVHAGVASLKFSFYTFRINVNGFFYFQATKGYGLCADYFPPDGKFFDCVRNC